MTATTTTTTSICQHCGEICEDERIQLAEQVFCCEGCKLVYEILNTNNLSNYYQIASRPGISLKGRKVATYAYLEEADIQDKLLDFRDDHITKVHFHLPQIHCASCVWLLENLYRLHEPIQASTVNFLKRRVDITYRSQDTNLRKVVELLASIGYAPSLQLDQMEAKPAKAVNRRLYYQLGLAGFTFGNIMLFSFPEYLGLEAHSFSLVFGLLNITFALPVLLYSGIDYLKSAYFSLKNRHLNIDIPIAIGMLTLFGRSLYEILTLTGTGYLDSLAGLVFFLLIGKWFQQKTYHHLSFERDYRSYFPIAVQVKSAEGQQQKALHKLQIGDTMIVKHEEIIPTDAYLLKGRANIDYSFVTGESEPIRKKVGEKIYAGGKQIGSRIELSVCRKVEQSYLTQLWNHHSFKKEENQSTQLADTIGTWFTYSILTIAALTLIYWLPKDIATAINAFTSVLIIACPCAVALSIPFTYGNILRLLARQDFYLKNIQVIDRLQRITDIVFDKTGTLTDNSQQQIHFVGNVLDSDQKRWIKTLAAQSAHPISQSIVAHLNASERSSTIADFEEVLGKGIQASVEEQNIRIGAADFMLDLKHELSSHSKGTFVEINHQIVGYFKAIPTYRKGWKKLLRQFKADYQIHLLSGDNDQEKSNLLPHFETADHLHFRQSPNDKLQFVEQQQATNKKLLMVGDGLNDAGALQQSDVGIVITENLNNFSPACDAILAAEHFHRLPDFLRFARIGKRIVLCSYLLALLYNAIGLSFAVQALLSPVIAAILMP
ncbi:MAG: heavy metal translocating P-type ATPase metal-binding domain-containing protein, partial [Bacteroidota bacterium]